MLKRRLTAVVAGLGLYTAAALTAVPTATADTVTIRYSNWLPPDYFLWTDVLQPWTEEVAEVTDGRVEVKVLPKVVGSPKAQFDVIRDGLADMSWITAAYTPDRFPATEFAELPMMGREGSILGPAFEEVFREHIAPLNEFAGVKVVSIFPLTPSQVFTSGTKVDSVEDMAGLKFRSPTNAITAAVKLADAVPIHKATTEAYEMLSTGVIDGQITQPNSVVGFGAMDLTDHAFLLPGGISNAVCLIGVNPEKWAQISEKDRKAIMEIGGKELARRISETWVEADEKALKTMRQAGYDITRASDAQIAKFRELLKPIETDWIAKAREADLENPREVLAEYRAAIREATPSQ